MVGHVSCLTIALVMMASVANAEKPKLPAPPDGFEWQWCDEVRVGLLKPDGWHYHTHNKGATLGYFITKESIAEKGEFATGLTLNVIPDVGKKTGGQASDVAKSIVGRAIRDRESVLTVIPPGNAGPTQTFGCRVKRNGSIMHYFLIADNGADKLYLFYFESPEKEWDAAWKTGEQLLKKLVIDLPEE